MNVPNLFDEAGEGWNFVQECSEGQDVRALRIPSGIIRDDDQHFICNMYSAR